MANDKTQSFANHTRFVPPFHFFILPVLLVNVGWSLYSLRYGFSFTSIFNVVLAIALLMLGLFARLFALTAQDRIIRLEMRLRMTEVLPPDLRARFPEFNIDQLISLRFASDAELPALARKVLEEKVSKRKTIKQMIQNWQGDYLRV